MTRGHFSHVRCLPLDETTRRRLVWEETIDYANYYHDIHDWEPEVGKRAGYLGNCEDDE
jgi:hypothetical protein